ncbi:MAG: class I SAM-dependent methyltransferase [Candidatus Eisenbacteria bacterium]|nr:methyltransferase domain-containing protein [Candidatus Eisenbacteria bacterium]
MQRTTSTTSRTIDASAATSARSIHAINAAQTAKLPDLDAIKARQRSTWASGDYGRIGVQLQIVGETLCQAVDLRATDKVLDVAAGNGNASLAAARHFAEVTSTDYVPELLEQGRARAARLPIEFRVADAEALPFEDETFDVVLSTFGVMFAPNQERVASEMLRVAKPGGKIGLASWTPDGFIGAFFRLMTAHVPPPAGLRSPLEWGTETRLVELFGPHARDIRTTRKAYVFRFQSAEHWIYVFRTFYGPANKAFAALDEEGQRALHEDLARFLREWNRGGDVLSIPGDYLEAVITK